MVIVVHDQADALEHNLPQFLTVAGQVHGEIIVVDDSSTDSTPDILKKFKQENAHLYTTFLPKSVYNNSRTRLALNIGAKAALAPHIMFADITRPPLNEEWLESCTDGQITMVYGKLKHGQPEIYRQPFNHIADAATLIMKAERHGNGGHKGRFFRMRRGMYDAMVFSSECSLEVIKLFDQHIGAGKRMCMGISVFLKNLFA